MSAITWVLAADGSRARVFETQGLKLDLRQVEELRNPASRASEATEQDRETFAKSIGEFLERSRREQRFDRLRLAVEPRFLDVLRAHLSSETRKLVYEDANKDTADTDTRNLRHHLDRP
ncbi:Protein required for attachment to host cells [Caballeronia hypogeia]|uniref:Protein required for attachment to host cells n=1 Tax=Caballeronia hypogeia TaxID=1777140 RepID=A0A158AJV7_9BURK|nr:host attachment protein [Caballeronia hypogeia]SAK58072.1 Protein required for attachment to host cells [Caballeronia hypogeia]